ncbi:MAG: CD225/dispanin family protein [Candidatus Nanopelagicales bacterium]|nr:CD225/dispanin family protein [Candidatus Nanopelagicales bacterium]MCU0298878.1 CD225/dispanin family protein [Candidatus Nanopelagicales bacterium]
MSQPPPPPGYGYGYGQPRQTSSDAIAALVLAILSWVVCPFVLAIVALVFASKASRAIAASNGWLDGAGMVTAAKIISWINIAIGLLFIVFMVFALIVGAFSSGVSEPTDNFNAVMQLL